MNRLRAHVDKPRPDAVGRALTRLRVMGDLQQIEVAMELAPILGHPVNPGRICEWEQGRPVPRPLEALALLQILGGRLDDDRDDVNPAP